MIGMTIVIQNLLMTVYFRDTFSRFILSTISHLVVVVLCLDAMYSVLDYFMNI